MTDEILKQLQLCLDLNNLDEAIPIISQCISARDTIFSRNSVIVDSRFNSGSLVLDTKNGEVGFIIGPINVYGDISKPVIKLRNKDLDKKSTILIVTRNLNSSDVGPNKSEPNFRVRYTKKEFLIPLEVEENIGNSTSDLNEFCSKQCIMECTSECKLYKYKKKN